MWLESNVYLHFGLGINDALLVIEFENEPEASRNWLLVYAKNPIGMAETAATYMFGPQLVSSTTTSTTTMTAASVTGGEGSF